MENRRRDTRTHLCDDDVHDITRRSQYIDAESTLSGRKREKERKKGREGERK